MFAGAESSCMAAHYVCTSFALLHRKFYDTLQTRIAALIDAPCASWQVLIALLYGTMYWNKGKVPTQSAPCVAHTSQI